MTDRTPKRWTFRLAVALVAVALLAAAGLGWWWLWGAGQRNVARAGDDALYCDMNGGSGDATPSPTPNPATQDNVVIGLLTMPGSMTMWPIHTGVSDAALDAGVGWYQQTAEPGQVGNMALVGRRLPSGGPFDNILNLNVGDTVTVTTCTSVFTYTLVTAPRDLTVQPTDDWVLDAVPGSPSAMPTDAWLTLIANQSIESSPDRAVGFAKLTATSAR